MGTDSTAQTRATERDYFRVKTRLRLRSRRAAADDISLLEHEILEGAALRDPDLDPAVASVLARMEAKLDRILAHLGLPHGGALIDVEHQEVMLSGSGMHCALSHPASTGDVLVLEFELPGAPPRVVRGLATVRALRRDPSEDFGPVVLEFRTLRLEDRDAVVQHTLEVQRRELRERAEQRMSR